ncbi:MAG: CapA family protein, partial [Deltaproteobacteria bacterium]|nr:CapA family protein [Deltaproteobacteria bacterium]
MKSRKTMKTGRAGFRTFLAALAALFLLPQACGGLAKDPQGPGDDAVYTLAAMGDIMLGTENLLPPDGAGGFFADVKPYLAGKDIIFGNLEGPLTDRGRPSKDTSTGRSFCFRTPPSYGEV